MTSRQIFFGFIFFHVLIWTLVPYIGRYSLHHDVLEGITQGLQHQLGYSKHPFLSMWLVAFVWKYVSANDFSMYLFSQLSLCTGFYFLWRLNQCLLNPRSALLATLLTDGLMAFNFDANVLTPDTFQIPCWAAIGYYGYQLINQPQKTRNWLLVGSLFGLGFLIKYQIIFLLMPFVFLFLADKTLRPHLMTLNFLLATISFLIIISPHLYWMSLHDFDNLNYSKQSIESHQTLTIGKILINYLSNSLAICGCVLGLYFITTFKTKKNSMQKSKLHVHYIISIAFGPWLMTLLFALVTHTDIMARWMTPYFGFLGTFLCYIFRPKIEFKQIKVILVLFTTGAVGFMGLSINHLVFNSRCDALYPNQQIARFLEQEWRKQSALPLQYISGNRYLVSSIIPYTKDLPKPFFSLDLASNPWVNIKDIQKNGGIFVWDLEGNYAWDIESSLNGKKPLANVYFPHLIEKVKYQTFFTIKKNRPIKIAYVIFKPTASDLPNKKPLVKKDFQ